MSLAVKSGRPVSRDGLVRRPRLIARLREGRDAPLVVIAAPAGYGKTSLLAEWAEGERRPSAWLALEPWHRDPVRLVGELAQALQEIEPLDVELDGALECSEEELSSCVLPALAAALERGRRELTIVLDDVHAIGEDAIGSLRVLATVSEHLPRGSQLVLASRAAPALPLGRLRGRGALLELSSRDLAMTREEARELLRGAKLDLDAAGVDMLMERTEGWPVMLYLASLSARDEPDARAALQSFAGDDGVVADYLAEEVLSGLHAEDLEFLVRASVIERLSGPLCDAALQRSDSARVLVRIARSGAPLSVAGRGREHYRAHRLLREMLLAELHREDPLAERALRGRASVWHAAQGNLDDALAQAVAAADAGRAGELLWASLPGHVANGRNGAVQGWLKSFSEEDISAHAPLALTAAHSALALGDLRRAEHWGRAAAAALERAGEPPAVDSLRAGLQLVDAFAASDGVMAMGERAANAHALESQDSPWRSVCRLLQGVAAHLAGDREQAREWLQEGARLAALHAPSVETLCLAQLAMLLGEEGEEERAIELIDSAMAQIERCGLGGNATCALAFAVSAHTRARAGRVDEGKRDARRAAHLLEVLGDFVPWYGAQARIALARAALRLADVAAARALLAEASQLARRTPGASVFQAWLDETWALADSVASSALAGPATLTLAELRILRFLPTHLTLREIACRLHVSTNTVKTQAHAVYRKLDVRSRSEAVTKASRIGLIDG